MSPSKAASVKIFSQRGFYPLIMTALVAEGCIYHKKYMPFRDVAGERREMELLGKLFFGGIVGSFAVATSFVPPHSNILMS